MTKVEGILSELADMVEERLLKRTTIETPKSPPRPLRSVEEFKGENPVGREGIPVAVFQTQKRCGTKYRLKDGTDLECPINLAAHRVWQVYLEVAYNNPHMAQLKYDKTKWAYFLQCPIHGPVPPEGDIQPSVRVSQPP